MSDPGYSEFYERVSRIEKARASGFGFEAVGTLGRSFYTGAARRGRRWRFPVVRLLIVCAFSATIAKALFLHHLGFAPYQDRIAQMQAAGGVQQVGAWLLQPDVVTVALARQITLFASRSPHES
ncbi:MAG: hypothetical protein MUF74_06535 [Cypionkella sp.]|jgi:hypothetical protein|nr:hypothetical protein [Cypionkella sp.]